MRNFNLNKRTILSCIIAILVFILVALILLAFILELTFSVNSRNPQATTTPSTMVIETTELIDPSEWFVIDEITIPIVQTEPTIAPTEPTVPIETTISTEPINTEPAQISSYYTYEDAVMIAKVVYSEARGVRSQTQQACVVWVILNRVDAHNESIYNIITARGQFAWNKNAPTVDDRGRDLVELALDVLGRWEAEKNGEENVGRVLPSTYMYFHGKGGENHFREQFLVYKYWDYSLPTPYDT